MVTDSYWRAARAAAASANVDEWEDRCRFAARRILSAVCLRVTSDASLQATDSRMLPTIGYYYALFHMCAAGLALDHATDLSELRPLRHKKLIALLNERLIARGLVRGSVGTIVQRLKRAREYTNYVVGGKMIGDDTEPLQDDELESLPKDIEFVFDTVTSFIKAVAAEFDGVIDVNWRIAGIIGDDIGDDVGSMYLSDAERDQVTGYLVAVDFST